MYLINLFKEINIWRKVKFIAKENEEILNRAGFRVDWIGRIYTVINLPEEVVNQPISREGYVLMKLREFDSLFLNMGIADAISPEIMEIEDSDSYLLILSPDRDYIKFIPFVWFLFKLGSFVLVSRILYIVFYPHWDKIIDYFNKFVNFIF